VFVTYVHRLEESREKTRTSFFETKLLIVPARELEKRMEVKKAGQGGRVLILLPLRRRKSMGRRREHPRRKYETAGGLLAVHRRVALNC